MSRISLDLIQNKREHVAYRLAGSGYDFYDVLNAMEMIDLFGSMNTYQLRNYNVNLDQVIKAINPYL